MKNHRVLPKDDKHCLCLPFFQILTHFNLSVYKFNHLNISGILDIDDVHGLIKIRPDLIDIGDPVVFKFF